MTYDLASFYNVTNPAQALDAINVASSFLFLDALLVVAFVVSLVIAVSRTGDTKESLIYSTVVCFILAGLVFIVAGASGVTGTIDDYGTRVIVTLVLLVFAFIWKNIGEAS